MYNLEDYLCTEGIVEALKLNPGVHHIRFPCKKIKNPLHLCIEFYL